MNLIGIAGRMGSGKDTVGQIIQYLTAKNQKEENFENWVKFYYSNNPKNAYASNWEIKKFAGKLKQICSLLSGIPVEDFEKQDVKDSFLPDGWNIKFQHDSDGFLIQKMKVRTLLQKVGTEAMRNQIHENVWVNALFADYKEAFTVERIGNTTKAIDKYPNWIITDTRFPNEAEAIKSRGGIMIRVSRTQFFREQDLNNPEYVAKHNHPSETSLDDYKFDYTIDNNGTLEELVEKVKEILTKEGVL